MFLSKHLAKAKKIHINDVIKVLTLSDLLIWSGIGLVSPIFAVFVTDQIKGGSVEVAGLASAIYFGSKSLLQLPIARLLDIKRGEQDDYKVLLAGSIIIGVSPFFYLVASLPWHIYIIQAFYGIGCALAFASWDAIFTRHVDKDHIAFEWSAYYTINDIGSAIAAGLGGWVADALGFRPLFLLVGIVASIGALINLILGKILKKKR